MSGCTPPSRTWDRLKDCVEHSITTGMMTLYIEGVPALTLTPALQHTDLNITLSLKAGGKHHLTMMFISINRRDSLCIIIVITYVIFILIIVVFFADTIIFIIHIINY